MAAIDFARSGRIHASIKFNDLGRVPKI
jgi:hypothetical protein